MQYLRIKAGMTVRFRFLEEPTEIRNIHIVRDASGRSNHVACDDGYGCSLCDVSPAEAKYKPVRVWDIDAGEVKLFTPNIKLKSLIEDHTGMEWRDILTVDLNIKPK